MDGYTAAQIRAAEAPLLAAGEPLMARAAHALAQEIWRLATAGAADVAGHASASGLAAPDASEHDVILVVVGSGNNGGDALFAAAELAGKGAEVAILPVADTIHERGLAAAKAAGARDLVAVGADEAVVLSSLRREAAKVRVVVDGILGTGSAGRSALRGIARAAVSALVAIRAEQPEPFTVVAVDIPSGLDADTGVAPDAAILPATVTVTFGACKAGLLRGDGPRLAGRVAVIDIGLIPELASVKPEFSVPDLP